MAELPSEGYYPLPSGGYKERILTIPVNGIPVSMEVVVLANTSGTVIGPATESSLASAVTALGTILSAITAFNKHKFSKVAFNENDPTKYYAYMNSDGDYYFEKQDFAAGLITFAPSTAAGFVEDWAGVAGLAWQTAPIY